jgi:hypothetical protein
MAFKYSCFYQKNFTARIVSEPANIVLFPTSLFNQLKNSHQETIPLHLAIQDLQHPQLKQGSLPKECHPQQKPTPSQSGGTITAAPLTIPISFDKHL